MRAVVQRTLQSRVSVDNEVIAAIGQGLTVLLGVGLEDTEEDVSYLAEKIVNLRIFSDNSGKMNLSLLDIKGELLVISQFTLFGDCRKGRRPSFDEAAPPKSALKLYEAFIDRCKQFGIVVATGKFQAEMTVTLDNHGPVTILLDSKRIF
ncbi:MULTISPECIES: D-aminoacyl-tRNA deacylase [Pelosinus]|uniref:D-aminoacyl-tRNA deacylase n=1 Tax=Pelosinus fermentans B4 TaxID=1149862 RepID=I9LD93_9FIRM|nr:MULTISPECIES: D-aminoacyl-tRNA deacylase [Pelosinus]EIW18399.1 D-tyrosyl-tRNA(Tyr) deacylase [Pelosinus fermentans B4]EIW24412.1 D-tyrosyl-tRNA(Tyr) deacylase [Pelosinus fermentans A11]OAM94529.1 D-tyrosyl-tRNA(Tyr) deacylase [Pelosinus fermentans DSM 17108]SDR11447.1 D-tyrosyl-tRNA(Tyr) deacylase [Pelosinus fermentans]